MRYYNLFEGGRALRIAVGITVLGLLLAGAAGAATPISSCTTISSPGTYVLNQSIINSTASACIAITKSDVVFDGAGYTIDGVNVNYETGNYGVYVYNSTIALTNVTVKNLIVKDWFAGITYSYTQNGSITNNTASNNSAGIQLYISSNNNLTGNKASSNYYYGIVLPDSSNNNLADNTASNNHEGFSFGSSSNNYLTGNTASNNYKGILLTYSNNNTIYNNYFNNTINAQDDGNNIWNITKTAGMNIIGGSYIGGNYWSDYTGNDLNGDGLGDTLVPYNSSGNIANGGDFLPLITAPTPTVGSISGYKIKDTNGNGRWNVGEKGIPGWTIKLIGITAKGKDSKVIRKETFTDATGFYEFNDLPKGNYRIQEVRQTGWKPTNSDIRNIELKNGQKSMNNNFTNILVKKGD